jgi:hypothetical protein
LADFSTGSRLAVNVRNKVGRSGDPRPFSLVTTLALSGAAFDEFNKKIKSLLKR